MKGLTDVG